MNPLPKLHAGVALEEVRDYLRRRIRSEVAGDIIGSLLSLAGAALVFLVIFWAAYIFLLFENKVPLLWLWVSLAVIAFSFIAYATTDSEYLSQLEVRTVDGRPAYSIPLPGGWRLSNVNYMDPKTARSLAKVVLQLITSGPRALVASWRYARRAAALRAVDADTIAPMVRVLAERGRRVPYEDLGGLAMREPEKAFSAIILLDVAQHLEGPPPGLVISSRVREQITGIKADGMDF